MQIPCGSELARDSGVAIDIYIDWPAAIASKLAPTGSGTRQSDPKHASTLKRISNPGNTRR